ncbi:putative amidohydrolase [Rheinheimera pacifica]|uniref:amidohydrolase n=1 Tax=Rheinheimera pacifica TaxID=173990 RepID=UPI000CB9AB04|nr:amidohydrolase [Rheinheimera pacifica]MDR6984868.1 putative amidohydrolase [Rheinheimera pacifica]PKM17199.1 MAG: amidohydrolase [Gammaproteobacteria bacterium HGW-Gammaproteobacteria-15]
MPDITTAINVALVQTALVWQNPVANRQQLAEQISRIQGADIILLPEMFTTGFSMQSQHIAEPEGDTLGWLQQQAQQIGAALVGSVATRTDNGCVNRCYFVTPEGQVTAYDKKHLFRMAGEHQAYIAGDQRVVVSWRGWRFLLQVCYDLRFPVFSRNCHDYDIALYVANWPAARRHAWRTLLQARAIENQAFVLGCNRVGTDGNNVEYSGDSLIVDYLGQAVADHAPAQASVLRATLDYAQLKQYRQLFPAHLDADAFVLS